MKSTAFLIIVAVLLSINIYAQESCDYKVEILVDGDEFDSEDFKWRMRAVKLEGGSTNITGTAKITSNNKVVKSYKPWTSVSIAKQKTSSEYSPNLKGGRYEIEAEIDVKCGDTNNENNVDTKKIEIKSEEKNKRDDDEEEETDTEDEPKKKTSTTSQQNVLTSNQQTTTKKATPKIEEESNVVQLKSPSQKNQITADAAKAQEIVYKSSNENAKGLILIFLLTISIIINIVLIWRR